MQMEAMTSNVAPTARLDEDDDGEYLSAGTLRQQYLDYLYSKQAEIEEQKEARRYYHGAQLDADQQKVLQARGQPMVVINAIAKKINRIVGLTERTQNNPKAFPRNPEGEAGADIATETVAYAADENDWKTREPECVRQCAIEGIAGIEFKLIEGDEGDPDVGVQEVLGDDYFYDPMSVRYDFSDSRYEGVGKWVALDAAIELFPEQEELLRGLMESGSELTTYADREFRFLNIAQKRVRLVEHWYKHKGKWRWCFYVSSTKLDEGTSPFYDHKNKTMSRFVMFRCAVDHDGDSYGFFRNLKSLQDEKNQRRSRSLALINNRRLIITKGAVDDVEVARREWARHDGVIEKNPQGDVTPDNTQFELEGHMRLLDQTNQELNDFANVDAATMTGGSVGNLSGYAINLLQQPGLAEIGFFLIAYRGWKLRVYRALWGTIQGHWKQERWIRVNGEDSEITKWLKINGLELDQYGQPTFVNAIGKLNVNFKFDEGPDLPNTMADAYEVVKNDPNVPWQVKVELMPISSKRKKQILAAAQVQPDPADVAAKKLTLDGMSASNEAARAVAAREYASAEQKKAAATGARAKAFRDVVDAAVDAAHFGLDAVGAAQTWQQDSAAIPLDAAPPVPLPAIPQTSPSQGDAMPQMPPPAPGGQGGYSLPF